MESLIFERKNGILSHDELLSAIRRVLEERRDEGNPLKRVLLVPPDMTRLTSGGGIITNMLWHELTARYSAEVCIMPAIGSHYPMTREERCSFYGSEIPDSAYIVHDWKKDVVHIGTVPAEVIRRASLGRMDEDIPVEVNKELVSGSYDLIFSIGQVLPHEVVGMANYSKNIFVGCGGRYMIDRTHCLGALCGIEQVLGRDHSGVRQVFDYAEEHFLTNVPLCYMLTVVTSTAGSTDIHGLYTGRERYIFERAVSLSQKLNIIHLERRPKKIAVLLREDEFRSMWLGNKAVYRTRIAVDDGGELIIMGRGLRVFGEDDDNERLIRRHGFRGTPYTMQAVKEDKELAACGSVFAHLLHASSEGRFSITYCTEQLTREDIEGVGFNWMSPEEAEERYSFSTLKPGWNTVNGEEIYYIENPAAGLWVYGELQN